MAISFIKYISIKDNYGIFTNNKELLSYLEEITSKIENKLPGIKVHIITNSNLKNEVAYCHVANGKNDIDFILKELNLDV